MRRLFVGLGIVALISCGKKSLPPEEFVKWINDEANGLCVKKTIGQYAFEILYKPLEYIVLMETKNENISKKEIEERIKDMDGMQYYTLKIESKNGKELMSSDINYENEYYGRLEYFMAPMQDDISLIEGKDTLPCLLFHFERNYGMAPYSNFLLGFEKDNTTGPIQDKIFLFNDRILGIGPIILSVKSKDIQNIPSLKTYN